MVLNGGWPIVIPVAVVLGISMGLIGAHLWRGWTMAYRPTGPREERRTRVTWQARLTTAFWRPDHLAALTVGGLGIALILLLLPAWPGHHEARQMEAFAAGAWMIGSAVGAGLSRLQRSGWGRMGGFGDADRARFALLEAIDGFSHAQWVKYLGGVAMLTRSLARGGDPTLILPRLTARLASYESLIRPQMLEIRRLLHMADIEPGLVADLAAEMAVIDSQLLRLAEPDQGSLCDTDLTRLAEAAEKVHLTVEALFQELGRHFSTDLVKVLQQTVVRAGEEAADIRIDSSIDDDLPLVFGRAGELGNIFENLLSNAVRAVRATASKRPPLIQVKTQREGGLVTVLVIDSGPGIPPDKMGVLFDRRAAGPSQHGRGLAYAARRLHQVDGRIGVLDTATTSGTTIAVTLRTLKAGRPRG